ncbi:MAG TPA: hypothetical protein VIF13_02920 [Hyphomicrobium sp.]|jgi:hypothetical protein
MQQLGGLLLMLSGAAALGGYLYLPPPPDGEQDVAEVTRISIAPYHKTRARDVGTRTFSPASPAFRQVVIAESRPAAAEQPPMPGAWTTVVTAESASSAVLRSPKPTDARTRYLLARDLQRGLKRAGCYGGEINGAWTMSTRRAMAAFIDRANATLPSDKPDYVLLSLVQSHDDISCSAGCPAGQIMDQGGRCVPQAVIAQASKRSKRLEERRLAEARLASRQTHVAAAMPEKLPWLDRNGQSLVTPSAPRPAPPPGMMSMGGPSSGMPLPLSHPAPIASNWRAVPIENSDGSRPAATATPNADPAEPKIAALAPEDMAPADAANIDPTALPSTMERPEKHHRARGNSHRGWNDRPRHYGSGYGSRGHGRRGQPRPGTMRYNLVQSLGGIY